MTNANSSMLVKTYIPKYIKEMIEKIAEDRKKSVSEVVGQMIVRELSSGVYEDLNKTELKYVQLKKIESETEMLKYIRSKNAEKLNFIKNIRKQMYMFSLGKKDIDKKDILVNMRINLEIARANKWTNEAKIIKTFLSKKGQIILDHDKKQIEVHRDGKTNI